MRRMGQGHKQQMHTTFRNVVYRLAARAGARLFLEPDNLLPGAPQTRPACLLSACPTSASRLGVASPSSPWIVLSPHSKVLPCGLLLLVRWLLLNDMPNTL